MSLFDHVFQEYSRKHENEVNHDLKFVKPKYSQQISNMIQTTLQRGHKVWLTTDWHLWMFDKKTREVSRRSDFTKVINTYNKTVDDNDLVIYLGDLTDGEVEKRQELGKIIQSLKGTKILVRGNNDLFPDEWYLQHGFKFVTPKFIYKNILFSHMPLPHNNRMNIHGHIHGYKTYYLPYNNMIDVAFLNGRKQPVDLRTVIDALPKYAKQIKMIPEKFEQYLQESYVMDPFGD